jgi:HEAT repeat protein
MAAEPDSTIRYNVKWALYTVNPTAGIPEIRRLLESEPGASLHMVSLVLPLLGPEGRQLVPSVMKAIQDPSLRPKTGAAHGISGGVAEQKARLQGVVILGAFGGEAKEAVPLLRKLATDPDEAIRHAAKEALRRLEASSSTTSSPGR